MTTTEQTEPTTAGELRLAARQRRDLLESEIAELQKDRDETNERIKERRVELAELKPLTRAPRKKKD